MYNYSGIHLIELAKESQRGKPGQPVPLNQALIQMVFNGFFGMRKFSYLKGGTRDFKTKRGVRFGIEK